MRTFRRYVLAKAGWYLLALLLAMALNFSLPRLIPGNPVTVIVSRTVSGDFPAESLERIYTTYVREFGLDQPVHVQFLTYLAGVLRGDWGTSFMLYPAKVRDLIGQALPWTLALQVPSILVGWLLGNLLGAVAAYTGGRLDTGVLTASLLFSNIPYYGLAIILLYLLAVQLPLFPTGGGYTFGSLPNLSWTFLADAARHHALPFLSLVLVSIGGQAIGMREMALYEVSGDGGDRADALCLAALHPELGPPPRGGGPGAPGAVGELPRSPAHVGWHVRGPIPGALAGDGQFRPGCLHPAPLRDPDLPLRGGHRRTGGDGYRRGRRSPGGVPRGLAG